MKLFILRLGPPIPIPEINDALMPHFENDPNARAFLTPVGVISIFNTDSTPKQVADSLKAVSDQIMFFVMPLDKAHMQFPGLFEIVGEDEAQTPRASCPLTVDEILDKVNASGIESLTEVEKAILEGRA